MLSFKSTFSLSTFTFIKRLFSSSSLSAVKVVSSAYLRLLVFLSGILIPACASSSPAFLMMYSGYKLNKQSDNIQPWHIPFPFWNQSVVPCPVLTVASWPAYKFLKRQGRSGGLVFPSLSEISTVYCDPPSRRLWHSQWSRSRCFLELSGFFNDIKDVGNLISDSSAFSKSNLNIWKFSVHVLLKPRLEDFEHHSASMWNESNFVVIWTFFGIALLWDWNENGPFPVLWPLLIFPNFLACWIQHFNSIIV